jgi:hypothetical protein
MTDMKTKTESFRISSGSLVLGDPCYDTNPTFKAQNGPWTAHVVRGDEGSWGTRVRKVIVHHEDFNPADPRLVVEEESFSVDSGQAGVFDGSVYGGDSFYDRCCDATLTEKQCDYVRQGFVTSSGYGDGWYSAEIHIVDGLAVCVELVFI